MDDQRPRQRRFEVVIKCKHTASHRLPHAPKRSVFERETYAQPGVFAPGETTFLQGEPYALNGIDEEMVTTRGERRYFVTYKKRLMDGTVTDQRTAGPYFTDDAVEDAITSIMKWASVVEGSVSLVDMPAETLYATGFERRRNDFYGEPNQR